MSVDERLAMAADSCPSGDRPGAEAFRARLSAARGFASAPDALLARLSGAGPWQCGAVEEAQGSLIPPTREELMDELHGLICVAEEAEEGGVYRRIAEIIEVIDSEEAAFAWWLHAAKAGDVVAVAIVDELGLDPNNPEELPGVLQNSNKVKQTFFQGSLEVAADHP